VAVELSLHVPYSAAMVPKSLFQHNPHLRNAQEYQRALRASVLSSIAIEGVSCRNWLSIVDTQHPAPQKSLGDG